VRTPVEVAVFDTEQEHGAGYAWEQARRETELLISKPSVTPPPTQHAGHERHVQMCCAIRL
jgi:hypothetical protein